MSDGKIFQWAFNPPASYWDGASMILKHISGGNLDSLKGKKIVLLHLDAPLRQGADPAARRRYADKHGFTLLPIPVGLKEMQNQSAQWLQIRRERPDFVADVGLGRDECRRGHRGGEDQVPDGQVRRHLVVGP